MGLVSQCGACVWLLCMFAAVVANAAAPAADVKSYPTKPIRLIVAQAPGGSNDIIARIIGERLTEAIGQSVVIDNRPGAGGVVGTDSVAKALPDGYTLMIGATSTLAANPSLYTKMNLDPTRDLTPITQIASGPFVLAVPSSLPVKNVKELIALAKTKPGELNYGSSGIGSSLHLTAELFKTMASIDILFSPRGTVASSLAAQGPLHFLLNDLRDATAGRNPIDPANLGEKLILSIFPQTGHVATFPIDPTDLDMTPAAKASLVKALQDPPPRVPRFAFIKSPAWPQADAAMKTAFEAFAGSFGARAEVVEATLPSDFEDILRLPQIVGLGRAQSF